MEPDAQYIKGTRDRNLSLDRVLDRDRPPKRCDRTQTRINTDDTERQKVR
jgi:hypothetical protein